MTSGKSPRHWKRGRVAILALGTVFAVKLLVFTQLRDHPLLQPDAGLDTTAYVELARRVLAGDAGLGPGLYYVSPLYIYFLALVYGLAGSFAAVQVVQIALGTITVGLIFVMGRTWAGARAGWLGAGMAAACGVLTFHEVVLMQSALDPFLTACALASLAMALGPAAAPGITAGARWCFVSGACFGIQTLNRPHVLLPAVAIVLALAAAKRLKWAAFVAAGLAMAMLPVAARNLVVAGQWSLVSSHGGLNFYIGNHAGATGLYQPIPGIRPEVEGQREDTRRVAEAAAGRPLTDSEVSDHFLNLGLAWMRENPVAAARLFGRKLVLAFHADHVALPHSFEFFAWDAQTTLRWLVVNPWILVPLGLAGFLFARPRGSPETAGHFWIWAAFVPAYALALAVFFLAERYRLPLLVPLSVGAGMFVDWLLRIRAGREKLSGIQWMRVVAAVVLMGIVVNWPFRLADSREGDRLRMVVHAASRQDIGEAERWASMVAAASPAPADVEERLGRIFLRAGQPAAAARHLKNAEARGHRGAELKVDLAEAQHRLAETQAAVATLRSVDWSSAPVPLCLRAGRLASALGANDLAVTLFTRAVDLEPRQADAWAQLGFAWLFANQLADAERALREALRLNPSDSVALGGLAVCAARLGRTEEALMRANAALALDPGNPLAQQVRAALGGR